MNPSPLLTIRGWVFDTAGHLVGVVVELPNDSWRYRPFAPSDRLTLPTPTVKLVTTLRRYLTEDGLAGDEASTPDSPS